MWTATDDEKSSNYAFGDLGANVIFLLAVRGQNCQKVRQS
jgi:hypothetical protein